PCGIGWHEVPGEGCFSSRSQNPPSCLKMRNFRPVAGRSTSDTSSTSRSTRVGIRTSFQMWVMGSWGNGVRFQELAICLFHPKPFPIIPRPHYPTTHFHHYYKPFGTYVCPIIPAELQE